MIDIYVGFRNKNSKGYEYKVIEKLLKGKWRVKFINTEYETDSDSKEVRNGSIREFDPKICRIGQTNHNKYGSTIMIVEYYNTNDIIVQFENGYKVHTTYQNFKNKEVVSPYDKTVYGIGYIGEGDYKVSINRKNTIIYRHWSSMLERCYSPKYHNKKISYKGCSVCDEWHNFQNFAKWFEDNWYIIENEEMQLDKDIFNKWNKIYSAENCMFVPKYINGLFTRRQNDRGEYPIGVHIHKKTGHFEARCSTLEGRVYLGVYNTTKEAYYVYKHFKEKYIKEIADRYKDKIPIKLYEAMYRYEVDITD